MQLQPERYALIDMRKLQAHLDNPDTTDGDRQLIRTTLAAMSSAGVLNLNTPDSQNEFFPVMLKDVNSEHALRAYANSAESYDLDFANDVRALCERAGAHHSHWKIPD